MSGKSSEQISFHIHTYGCKVNTYDSGLLQNRLGKNGFVPAVGEPAVHILNTCAVTKEATREAVKATRRLKIQNPNALVVVTGCAAQVDTEEFDHLPGVDLVVANSHKSELESLIRRYYSGELRERIHKSNIFKKEDLEPGGGLEQEHTRAFLKIQDGCDSFCTFCVIPFARGKSRSLSIDDLVRRVLELEEAGVKEVVLTGVHIGDYRDGTGRLEDLIWAVLRRTTMPRVRLTSLEPPEVTERLLDLFADPRLCPHFHMSIQSANSKILHDMKRAYDAHAVEAALERIGERLPGAFVGMDVIAGFPGESTGEFTDTALRLSRLPWTRLHVFPYSPRPGTFAGRRPDGLQRSEIKRRAEILRALSSRRYQAQSLAQVGQVKSALALRGGRLLSRDFWNIDVHPPFPELNREVRVKVLAAEGGNLTGSMLDAPVR